MARIETAYKSLSSYTEEHSEENSSSVDLHRVVTKCYQFLSPPNQYV